MHRRTTLALPLLLTAACIGEGAVERRLAEDGYTDITLTPADDKAYRFTATRDGEACQGTISIRGFAGLSTETEVVSTCGTPAAEVPADPAEASSTAPPVPAAKALLDVSTRGIGEPVVYAGMGRTDIRIAVSATQTDLASQAAAGLLEALTRNRREWIAGRATPELRRALKDVPLNINGPLAVFKRIELGPPQVEEQTATREVVVFDLATNRTLDQPFRLRVTFESNKFQAFEFLGETWGAAIDAYHTFDHSGLMMGAWAQTEAGVLPDGVAQAGEDVTVVVVYDRYRMADGKARVRTEWTHHPPRGKESSNKETISFAGSDEPLSLEIHAKDVVPGLHEVDYTVSDLGGRNPFHYSMSYEFKVAPKPAK
jgi:hypothetical protein